MASPVRPAILGAFVMLIAGFGAVVAYTVSLYAKVALATVLAVGPVFIALALFNSTKRFTESWLGQVVNYVVLQALVMVVLSLVLKVADKFAATSASADFGQAMMAGAHHVGDLPAGCLRQLPAPGDRLRHCWQWRFAQPGLGAGRRSGPDRCSNLFRL